MCDFGRSILRRIVRRGLKKGFTLVELLVVMAIIVIIAAISLPTLNAIQSAYSLDTVSQVVSGQFALARQTALATSHPVQVRFYLLADYNGVATTNIFHPATTTVYRAMQLFQEGDPTLSGTPVTPITKPYFFPAPVIIVSPAAITVTGTGSPAVSTDVSNLLLTGYSGIPALTSGDVNNPLPNYGTSYQYTYFRFRSSGRPDLSTTTSTNAVITLVLESTASKATTTSLPKNYVSLQLNFNTGAVTLYRP